MKKAFLVTISPMVRVVADENASEEKVIELAVEKMRKNPDEYLHATHCDIVSPDTELVEENVEPENKDGIVMCNNGVNVGGTSFHGVTIRSTINKLTKALGKPTDGDGGYKVNFEWNLKIVHEGNEFVVSVYDWKEGFFPNNQDIDFHIGGFCDTEELIAKGYIEKKLAETDSKV